MLRQAMHEALSSRLLGRIGLIVATIAGAPESTVRSVGMDRMGRKGAPQGRAGITPMRASTTTAPRSVTINGSGHRAEHGNSQTISETRSRIPDGLLVAAAHPQRLQRWRPGCAGSGRAQERVERRQCQPRDRG